MRLLEWFRGDVAEMRTEAVFSPNIAATVSNPLGGHSSATSDRTKLAVSTAYRCVELLTTTLAQFPAIAFDGDEELDPPPVLLRPDPSTTYRRFMIGTVSDMLFRGAALWLITSRGPDGLATSFKRIPRHHARIQWDPSIGDAATAEFLGRRQYEYGGRFLSPADVVHIPTIEPSGEATGIGPLEAGADVLTGQLQADSMVRSNFTEGVFPSGAVISEKPLSESRAQDIKDSIVSKHRGSREPVVFSGGVTWENFGITAKDSQWIEARQWGAADVARVMGVPAAMVNLPVLGGSQVSYSNAVSVRNDFLHMGLTPLGSRIEDALGHAALPQAQACHLDTRRYLDPLPGSSDDIPNAPSEPSPMEADPLIVAAPARNQAVA